MKIFEKNFFFESSEWIIKHVVIVIFTETDSGTD